MMPATAEAFAAGDISLRHAMVLASLAGGRTTGCFTRDEAILVDDARTMSWADFVRAIEYWRQHADPDGVERDARHDQALRRVHLSPGLRGTGILDGMLTPLGYATVDAALRRIERELFDADWAAARDRACTHSCDQPAERCQGDHIQPWTAGGATNIDNGQLRCGYHNRWAWQHPDPCPPPDPDRQRRLAQLEDWRAKLRASILAERADPPDG
jgi:hypothetical protein